jgi:hypothetical protein
MAVEITIGGEPISLPASRSAAQRAVACAYLVGGFALVVTVVEQVQAAADRRRRELDQEMLSRSSLRDFRARGNHESLTDWDAALRRADERIRRLNCDIAEGNNLASLIRRCWADVAEAEEQALSDYEDQAIQEFTELTQNAEAIAKAEWNRYEPYDPKANNPGAIDIAAARKCGASALNLRNEPADLLKAIFRLRRARNEYGAYRESARKASDLEYTRRNAPLKDPWKTLKDAEDAAQRKLVEFEKQRAAIGKKYPIALQVYGRPGSTWNWEEAVLDPDRDRQIETWIIEAMLEALETAPKIRSDIERARMLKPGITLRRTPEELYGAAEDIEGVEIRAVQSGLVVPASRAIVVQLLRESAASKSAWLQFPVRYRLRERALGFRSDPGVCTAPDKDLAPFFEPGRLDCAAVTEVFEGVRELRQAREAQRQRLLLIMDAASVPMAFFTGGGSLVFAGVVHALVRGVELGIEVQAYFAESALAGISFETVSECIWEHPSALLLASRLLEGGFDISSNVVGGRVGVALGALQTVLAIRYGVEAASHWAEAGSPFEG